MPTQYVRTDLQKMLGAVKLLNRQGKQIARFAVIDALRKTSTHVRRQTQEEITLKTSSITKRRKIIPPKQNGRTMSGELRYSEKAPPLASAFKGFKFVPGSTTPGGRSRGGKHGLRLKFRKDEAPVFVNAAWARQGSPGLPRRADPADRSAANGKFPTIRGRDDSRATRRVGRMPYFVAFGPSLIGLMESKPGFREEAQGFMAEALSAGAQRRYNRMLEKKGV